MNIRTLKFEQITAEALASWSAIQQAHPALSSPYFRPEFTQQVAAARADVEIAVLEESGTAVGFLPYQRTFLNSAQPIGGGASDFHGLIAAPDVECDPIELLRACRLSSWQFHNLVPHPSTFDSFAWSIGDSPYIDLSQGFDAYLAGKDNGASIMADYRRKKRRIEREFGKLRFEPHVADPAVLDHCIRWKAEQAQREGRANAFGYPWVVALLRAMLRCDGESFAAAMPVCYAGDHVAAMNFGMRSGGVFHSWFPVYNERLASCSPGYLHFIELMQAAPALGIRRIDLGAGDESYKQRLLSGNHRLSQGCVDVHSAVAAARRAWRLTRESIQSSPLRAPARVPANMVRRMRHWMALR